MNLLKCFGAVAVALGASTALAAPNHGAYLAGREAALTQDHVAAAGHFSRALLSDAGNPQLQEQTILALVAAGQVDHAAAIAREVQGQDPMRQAVQMVYIADAFATQTYDAVTEALSQGTNLSAILDPIAQAWADIGTGSTQDGLARLEALATRDGMRVFALYQKALAYAHLGDLGSAEAIMSGKSHGTLTLPRRAVLSRARILANLDRISDGADLLRQSFPQTRDPAVLALLDQLDAGAVPDLSNTTAPQAAMAEALYTIGRAIEEDAQPVYTLLYARAAVHMSPAHKDALLLGADLLANMGNYNLAAVSYGAVPPDHPEFLTAELGRARMLRLDGKPDVATEVLQALTRTFPDAEMPKIHLADHLKRIGENAEAAEVFTTVIDGADQPGWFLYYARGRAFHVLNDWPAARQDFEAALKIAPQQADVLNHLGYSLLERGEEIDYAVRLIKAAVEESPENAAIRDSLGWAYFKLRDYANATIHLEQAVELLPTHPEILDHLGDALWAVGRKAEAEFHWKRALSFEPEEDDVPRIQAKLAKGLDAVLADEGQPPLHLAQAEP